MPISIPKFRKNWQFWSPYQLHRWGEIWRGQADLGLSRPVDRVRDPRRSLARSAERQLSSTDFDVERRS